MTALAEENALEAAVRDMKTTLLAKNLINLFDRPGNVSTTRTNVPSQAALEKPSGQVGTDSEEWEVSFGKIRGPICGSAVKNDDTEVEESKCLFYLP